MPRSAVHTAVPASGTSLEEDTTLSEPLLVDSASSRDNVVDVDDEEDFDDFQGPLSAGHCLLSCALGLLGGVAMQIVSSHAAAYEQRRWAGEVPTGSDLPAYVLVALLRRTDMCAYVLLWAYFCACATVEKKRVYSVMSLVAGSCIAWMVVDGYLGHPAPFVSMIVKLGCNLYLCAVTIFGVAALKRNLACGKEKDEESQ